MAYRVPPGNAQVLVALIFAQTGFLSSTSAKLHMLLCFTFNPFKVLWLLEESERNFLLTHYYMATVSTGYSKPYMHKDLDYHK